MAFEDLLKSVEESAAEKEQELRRKSAAAVEEVRGRSKKRAAEIRQAYAGDARKSIDTEKNKVLYLTRGENKALLIKTREASFDTAFEEAGRRLATLRADPRYPEIFRRLLREAAGSFGGNPFVVHVDSRDQDLAAEILKSMGIAGEIREDLETSGGVVLSSADNSIIISNTVESRLQRARETKRQEIHAILTG